MSRPTRRAVLRGLGVSMALPWLEALAPRQAFADPPDVPRRLLVWMFPNGMPMDAWHPVGTGTSWAPSTILAPLDRHRQRLLLFDNLVQFREEDVEPHMGQSTGMLTGFVVPPWRLPPGSSFQSIDQRVADHVGADTAIRSLELSSESPAFCSEASSGIVPSCAPYSTVSWADQQMPLPREVSPQRVFDRLFAANPGELTGAESSRRRALSHSILDTVTDDLGRLDAKVSEADRSTLDQFLTAVRELERTLDSEGIPLNPECGADAEVLRQSGQLGLVGDVPGHVAAMRELMVMAFQCDRTRVISYMLGNARSDRTWPHLGIPDSHHMLSHHQGDATKLAALEAIGVWEMEAFASLLDRLIDVQDAASPLLDSTVVLMGSPIGDPDTHSHRRLPFVLAGGGTSFDLGRHVALPELTQLSRLHLTIAQRMGVPITSFGDAREGPLTEI